MVDYPALRRCALIAAAAIMVVLAVRCTDGGTPAPSGERSDAAAPAPTLAPESANPFDAVGIRHNRAVHAALLDLPRGAFVSQEAYATNIRRTLVPALSAVLAVEPLPVGGIDAAERFVGACSDPAAWLAGLGDTAASPAAGTLIRRIGAALSAHEGMTVLRDSLCAIERDACARDWGADAAGARLALGAIAVAKHSTAYWCALLGDGSPFDPASGLGKPGTVQEELWEKVIAADVSGFVTALTSTASAGKDLQTRVLEGTIAAASASALEAGRIFLPELGKCLISLLTK